MVKSDIDNRAMLPRYLIYGVLTGYADGIDRKQALLAMEPGGFPHVGSR